jgi:hypothetical protein
MIGDAGTIRSLPPYPRRRDDLAWRDIDGRVVIVDASDSQLHDLSDVATFYWLLMDGTHSLDDLLAAAMVEFDVDAATARPDLEELVGVLATKRLLEAP